MYDVIIAGCGYAGSVVARELAEKGNKKILIVDRRSHVGGNCYDALDEHGVLVHVYGPHIFHTGVEKVYQYLSRFTEWIPYKHEVVADVNGQYIPVPFNLNTLEMVFPDRAKELKEKLIANYGMDSKVSILTMRENQDQDIKMISEYVYKNVFLKYTMKQWGQTPEHIDPSVMSRVPVHISYDNRYFQDKYQGMPLNGFTSIFKKMLDHPNITVQLNTDIKDVIAFKEDNIYMGEHIFNGPVIFSGQIDELFDHEYGMLPYRTLDFVMEYYNQVSVFPKAVVNYTVSEEYTRATEYKKLTGQICNGSTIMKEYSHSFQGKKGQIPYYAIMNPENIALYNKYLLKAKKYSNLHMLGRLAEYKYFNMDAIVDRALKLAEVLNK